MKIRNSKEGLVVRTYISVELSYMKNIKESYS